MEQSPAQLEIDQSELTFIKKFTSLKHANEFEVRFGSFDKKGNGVIFNPGVDIQTFKKLMKEFSTDQSGYEQVTNVEMLKILIPERDRSTNAVVIEISTRPAINAFIRQYQVGHEKISYDAIPENWHIYTKIKADHQYYNNTDYAYRLSIAEEKPRLDKSFKHDSRSKDAFFRYMQRYSFRTSNGLFRYDFSIVKSSGNLSEIQSSPQVFEVELEFIGQKNASWMLPLHQEIYGALKLIQNCSFPLSSGHKKFILQEYLSSIWRRKVNMNDLENNPSRFFIGAMPVSLTLQNVIDPTLIRQPEIPNIRREPPDEYTVTEKADGERRILYIAKNGFVYLFTRNLNIEYTGLSSTKTLTVLDGELIPDMNLFLAFDILFLEYKDIRYLPLIGERDKFVPRKSLPGRWNHLDFLIGANLFKKVHKDSINVVSKKYQSIDIISNANKIWKNRLSDYKYNVDGIFFTPKNQPYPTVESGHSTWHSCLKWKPRSLLSIDFKVFVQGEMKFSRTKDGSTLQPYNLLQLYVQQPHKRDNTDKRHGNSQIQGLPSQKYSHPRLVPFQPTHKSTFTRVLEPSLGRVWLNTESNMIATDPISGQARVFRQGDIVEFVFDPSMSSGFEWKPIRIRDDKVVPNSFQTANQAWTAINEAQGLISDEHLFDFLLDKTHDHILAEEYQQSKHQYYSQSESLAERRESSIIQLRNFHNQIKRRLYNATSRAIREAHTAEIVSALLDLGCGRGGDYDKYRNAAIRQVLGIDVDKEGLNRLALDFHEKLSGSGLNPRVIITAQADFTRLLSNGDAALTNFDSKKLTDFFNRNGTGFFPLISCQFAMHYAFESELTLRTFLMNVYENLQIGGFFIATTFDGKSIFEALESAPQLDFKKNETLFGSIRKKYQDNQLSRYGQKIEVMFQSISSEYREEFLVNFEYLQNLMINDYDIHPISKQEARHLGFDAASDLFDSLAGDEFSSRLSGPEKNWSFLSRYMIFKKTGSGNAATIQKWLKKIRSPK